MRRIIYCFVVFLILFISASCSYSGENSSSVSFDSKKFLYNKNLWIENGLDSYEFSYSVTGGEGFILEADVSVVNGISSVTLKKIDNAEPDKFTEDELRRKIETFKDIGLYYTTVEDIFSGIEKMNERHRQRVEKNSDIYSVNSVVLYNSKGVPIVIKTDWSVKEGLMGLDGPDVVISNFKYTTD